MNLQRYSSVGDEFKWTAEATVKKGKYSSMHKKKARLEWTGHI